MNVVGVRAVAGVVKAIATSPVTRKVAVNAVRFVVVAGVGALAGYIHSATRRVHTFCDKAEQHMEKGAIDLTVHRSTTIVNPDKEPKKVEAENAPASEVETPAAGKAPAGGKGTGKNKK